MAEKLLFVCAHNVCRSPYLEEALRRELVHGSLAGRIETVSRGAFAAGGLPLCRVGAARLEIDPASRESVPLAAADIADAALVLSATKAEKGAVATMRPDLRSRSFTVEEAVLLGSALESEELRRVAGWDTRERSLAGYAAALNRLRGLVSTPPRSRRSAHDPLDIVDLHGQRAGKHARVFPIMDDAVDALVADVEVFLDD